MCVFKVTNSHFYFLRNARFISFRFFSILFNSFLIRRLKISIRSPFYDECMFKTKIFLSKKLTTALNNLELHTNFVSHSIKDNLVYASFKSTSVFIQYKCIKFILISLYGCSVVLVIVCMPNRPVCVR